jgi:hypothetical protein
LVYKKCQKVGIPVYHRTRPTVATVSHAPDLPLRDMTPERLTEVYGSGSQVTIHTGRISIVGESHIEYDIKSFTVYSGSITFLLDSLLDHTAPVKLSRYMRDVILLRCIGMLAAG